MKNASPLGDAELSKRLDHFAQRHGLSMADVRSVFGGSSNLSVRQILTGRKALPAPTEMLLLYFERHPEMVPKADPMDPEEVFAMFQAHFPLRKWELSLLYGRASASGYRWIDGMAGRQGRRAYVDQINVLFNRLRATGSTDEVIVKEWLSVVLEYFAKQDKTTRQARVMCERIELWLRGEPLPVGRNDEAAPAKRPRRKVPANGVNGLMPKAENVQRKQRARS